MIRPMFFMNGWPVLGPEPYQGEKFEPVSPEEARGHWEMIVFDDQNNEIKDSMECVLDADSDYLTNGRIYQCRDLENQKDTLVVTGFSNSGIAYWGKFMYSIV